MLKLIKHGWNLARNSLRDVGTRTKRSSKWAAVEKHFREANPTCACCGTTDKLQVHHVVPFSSNPALELDVSNLLVACMSQGKWCHLLICHGNNFKRHCPTAREYAAITLADPSKYEEIVALAKQSAIPNH